MSDLLTLLFRDSTNCSQKTSDLLKNGIFHMSLAVFPLKPKTWVIRSGHSWQKSNRERFNQVAHDKRATGSICTFSQANLSLLLTKKEQIVRKTYERISNPDPNSLTQRKKSLCFAEFKTVGIFAISLSFLKTFLDFFTRALLFYKKFSQY